MNDLEKELCSLEPSPPSKEFQARLEQALGEPGNLAVKRTPTQCPEDEVAPSSFIAWLAPLAVAAAVAFGAFLATTWPAGDAKNKVRSDERLSDAPKASTASVLPAFPGKGWEASELTDHFLGAQDEGVIHRTGQAPARRYRYRFVDVTTWEHPQANTVIQSSVPREEIVLVGLDPY